jgi:hypothetical protein
MKKSVQFFLFMIISSPFMRAFEGQPADPSSFVSVARIVTPKKSELIARLLAASMRMPTSCLKDLHEASPSLVDRLAGRYFCSRSAVNSVVQLVLNEIIHSSKESLQAQEHAKLALQEPYLSTIVQVLVLVP